jgi:hypothetical protein
MGSSAIPPMALRVGEERAVISSGPASERSPIITSEASLWRFRLNFSSRARGANRGQREFPLTPVW